ncbi:hypothetical protein [Pontibacter anaerobius]|uniref:YtxH domain-containing protein n=1 Tax=Pontibacter anaerobius TaxID=2993940 RepID=A0ABT3RHR6_9BACT|nr:hypothetical protein [Pontibacter anaerobius]MCX2741371.1 hypothetical protein [Pontibacter anaerobius]
MRKMIYTLAAVGLLSLGACASTENTVEEGADEVENAAEEVGEEVEEAADEVEDEIDE